MWKLSMYNQNSFSSSDEVESQYLVWPQLLFTTAWIVLELFGSLFNL